MIYCGMTLTRLGILEANEKNEGTDCEDGHSTCNEGTESGTDWYEYMEYDVF